MKSRKADQPTKCHDGEARLLLGISLGLSFGYGLGLATSEGELACGFSLRGLCVGLLAGCCEDSQERFLRL